MPWSDVAKLEQCLSEIQKSTIKYLPHLPARSLANIIHSLAKLSTNYHSRYIYAVFIEQLQATGTQIEHYNAQNVRNSLWAVVKLNESGKTVNAAFIEQLQEAGIKKIWDYNAQEVSNSLWAVAKLIKRY